METESFALAYYAPSHLTERATHAHPLHPAELASVPYGIALVRVRVQSASLRRVALCYNRRVSTAEQLFLGPFLSVVRRGIS